MTLRVRAVLFDLDGTLIDSAPDLAGTANDMRAYRGMPELPLEQLRPMVGAGARGMVGLALGLMPGDDGYDAAREEFLTRYAGRMTRHTRVFGDIWPVLDTLEARAIPWGIVTNKATHLAAPLVEQLGLSTRAATLVCGDTTPYSKPHPAPLQEAAKQIGVAAEGCIYVGDDLRDVQAGSAANMRTAAAAWGYLGLGPDIDQWGADHVIEFPAQLLEVLALP